MAYILLPSRRIAQPQGPVAVDWSNSLARDLAILVTGSSLQDAASGFIAKNVGLPVTGSAQGLVFDGNNSGFTAWTTRGNPHLAQKKTILALTFLGGAGYSDNYIACIGGGANGYLWITCPVNSTRVHSYLDHRGAGAADSPDTILFNGTDTAAKWHVVAHTCDSGVTNGSQFWLNGVATGAAHTATARSTNEYGDGTGEPYIGIGAGLYYNGGYLDVGNKVALFAHWNRILSAAEIREVSLNPWQLFVAPRRRIYFGASAGGGAVSGSSTATFTLTGSAAGAVQVAGSSAATVSLTGTAAGAVAVTGASAATFSLVGSAAGTAGVAGASAATVALTGTAQGAVGSSSISATSSATVSLTGTAAGAVAVTGASAATVSLTGAAQGAVGNVPITGESAATVSLTGSSAGAVQVSAASAGSTTVAGAAAAAVAVTGASIGSFDLIGAATGTVGYEGVYVESAATVSLAGTSAGKVAVAGESAAQVALGGTADGQIRIVGESAATISVVGVSVGAVTEPDVNLAQSEGTFTLAGSAAGVVWSRDDITASGRAFVGRKKATTGAIGRGGSATGRAGMEAG